MPDALFPLGRTCITPAALAACLSFPMPPDVLLIRHATGDWRELGCEDQVANQRAIADGSCVCSVYQVGDHRFVVITEADRSATTVLLAEEC